MILLPHGYQNQRIVLCEIIRDIEKELAELSFQKKVLENAFNSLNSEEDDLLNNITILQQETSRILQTKTFKQQ